MSDKTTELLAKYLDQDFKVFPMAEKPCTASDIRRIEKNFKIKMPKEYSEHICGEFPGLFVEVKEEVWPRPKPYDVGASWTFLFGIHSFTARSESPDWMRLDFVAKGYQLNNETRVLPLLKIIGDADVYCVNKKQEIVQFRHEENSFHITNMNFWQIFEHELADLRDRKERMKNQTTSSS